jgi:hypothetical protein
VLPLLLTAFSEQVGLDVHELRAAASRAMT